MNPYNDLADLTVQFGGIAAFSIVCCGFIFIFLLLWLWVACLTDVYRRDFSDRNMWLIAFAASFFFSPLAMLVVALSYYSIYKPKLKFWN